MLKLLKYSKISTLALAALIVGVMLFASDSTVYAGSTLSFSPSSGNKAGTFTVDLNVSTTGGEVAGFDIDVNLAGPIDFVSGTSGTLNCSPVIQEVSATKINIVCLGQLDYLNNSGSIARLTFSPTTTGSAALSMEVVDTDGTVDGTGSANFTVSVGGTAGTGGTTGGTTTGTTSGQLPQTSLLESNPVLIGGIVMFLGLGTLATYLFIERSERQQKGEYSMSLSDKVKNS